MISSIRTILLAIFIISFISCDNESSIQGTIGGAENMMIYFDQVTIDNTTQSLDQITADPNGQFKLLIPEGLEKGFYRIRFGARSIELLLDGTEKNITIDGKIEEISNYTYTITGSSSTEEYKNLMAQYRTKKIDANQLTQKIKDETSELTSIQIAMKVFGSRTAYLDVHKAVLEKINKSDLLGSPMATSYGSMVANLEGQKKREQASSKVKIGQVAPDIALPNPEGKTMKLSELKGQVVLLDFWASWCGPCRRENPHVVAMYDKYNKDGFTVFSVSLDGLDKRAKKRYGGNESQIKTAMDRSKEKWVGAIKKDNLKWSNHVSDLKKWESMASALYGVRSIPQTFLVDRDGNIAAINPRYNLEGEIQKLL